jgi:hypothetical protein
MSTKKKAKRDRKKMKAPPPSIPSPFDLRMTELSLSSTTATTANSMKKMKAPPPPSIPSPFDLLMTELSLSSTTATTANSMCYHGSTAERFSPGSDYRKAIQDFLSYEKVLMEHEKVLMERYGKEEYRCLCFLGGFETKYLELLKNLPELSQFLFAWSTHLFLNLDDEESQEMIGLLLLFGIRIKYEDSSRENSEKIHKYNRDIQSGDERGIINCLSRETKNCCDCMKQKKKEAKGMAKLVPCNGCNCFFPKKQMRDCIGCTFSFHSKECYEKYWPKHKIDCKTYGRY